MALTEKKKLTDSEAIPKRTKKFSTSDNTSYNVNSLTYPVGVSIDADKLHYVSFFISMRGKSGVFTDENPPSKQATMGTKDENRVDTTKLGRPVEIAGAAAGVTATLNLGRVLGSNAFKKSRGSGSTVQQANKKANLTQAGVGAASAIIGGMATSIAVKPDTTYRIADVITLHLPHAPKASYSVSYEETELGTLAGLISGGSSAVDTTKGNMSLEALKATILAGSSIGANKLAKTISDKFGGAPINGNQVMAATKIAEGQSLNPFREVLFKGTQFRRHQFHYKFLPKNKEESDHIYEIIKTFRYHAMPEISQGGLYLIHPSEFQIQYFFNGVENEYFSKIGTCVLENIDITYGSEDKFSSFRDGSPTEIGMNLTFRELATLTKSDIDKGF